jgi:hypothetical protein
MKVGGSLHQRKEIDALDSRGRLDGRNHPMGNGTELGNFGSRHFTKIQQVPSRLDDDRSCAGRLQRGVLDEEVLTFEDTTAWDRDVQDF